MMEPPVRCDSSYPIVKSGFGAAIAEESGEAFQWIDFAIGHFAIQQSVE